MTTEVFAYLVAAYLLFTNVPVLVSKLLTVVFCVMTKHDNGPSMAVWDVSLYTGYNTTAKENEIMLRNLINQIDKMEKTNFFFKASPNLSKIAIEALSGTRLCIAH
ncbi:unnamed protein product [Aphanomyces euteiches]